MSGTCDDPIARALARALAGERSAYASLYRGHVAMVMRVCSPFASLDRDDVDDVVQETFVRAFRGLDRLRSADMFRPWLLSIARNCALTLVKSRATSRRRATELDRGEESVELIPSCFVREAALNVVQRVIDEHPEGAEKETARLFYVEGELTAQEISERHGVGKSAVTMRLDRFRGHVKRRLMRRLLEVGLVGG